MYGKCKNCARLFSCPRPRNLKFGFCETDFEPKQKAEQPEPNKGYAMEATLFKHVGGRGRGR